MTNENTINPVGIIRTVVPTVVGAALAWLAVKANIVVDEGTSQSLIAGLTGLLTSVYYVIVRVAEKHFPAFGWLLGSPSVPVYPTNPSSGDVIPVAEAQRMVEDAVTEVYRQIEVGGGE